MTLATGICASFFSIFVNKENFLYCFHPELEGNRGTNVNENNSYFNVNSKFPK